MKNSHYFLPGLTLWICILWETLNSINKPFKIIKISNTWRIIKVTTLKIAQKLQFCNIWCSNLPNRQRGFIYQVAAQFRIMPSLRLTLLLIDLPYKNLSSTSLKSCIQNVRHGKRNDLHRISFFLFLSKYITIFGSRRKNKERIYIKKREIINRLFLHKYIYINKHNNFNQLSNFFNVLKKRRETFFNHLYNYYLILAYNIKTSSSFYFYENLLEIHFLF